MIPPSAERRLLRGSLPAHRSRLCRLLSRHLPFELTAGSGDGFVEPLFQQLARRELRQVLGDVDAAGLELQHFHGLALLARAEDEADRPRNARTLQRSTRHISA